MKSGYILVIILLLGILVVPVSAQENSYFERPLPYVDDDINLPVGILGTQMAPEGGTMWDFGSAYVSDSEFRSGGNVVQRDLGLRIWTLRAYGALDINGTNIGLSVPYGFLQVSGGIAKQPATSDGNGLGDITLLAKRALWSSEDGSKLTAAVGIELPTGKDDLTFDQSNWATNSYYPGNTRRLPLSWQPGSGSTDGVFSLAYCKRDDGKTYEAILAMKKSGKGDEDVRIGDLTILTVNSTKAVNSNFAYCLGLTYRSQKSDSYPNAPYPGVGQSALAGTTSHGNSLVFTPSIRYRTNSKYTIGLSFSFLVAKPDDGIVPGNRWGLLVSL